MPRRKGQTNKIIDNDEKLVILAKYAEGISKNRIQQEHGICQGRMNSLINANTKEIERIEAKLAKDRDRRFKKLVSHKKLDVVEKIDNNSVNREARKGVRGLADSLFKLEQIDRLEQGKPTEITTNLDINASKEDLIRFIQGDSTGDREKDKDGN